MKKWARLGATALVMAAAFCIAAMPAYAATRKKIKTVRVDVESNIEPDTRFGEEDIEIEVKNGAHYTYDSYEILNDGFAWEADMVPEIEITLQAQDGYYFSLTKASAVTLNGATYVKASKQNSSETLVLRVKLPSLREHVGEMRTVSLTDGGYAYWDGSEGAGSYELRLYRNGSPVSVSLFNTTDTQYDFRSQMRQEGSYSVKVRPVNEVNTNKKGDWVESETINLSSAQANAIRNGTAASGIPLKGAWDGNDADGWTYHYEDGTQVKNNWAQIDNRWYFFNEDGIMQTGWISWKGKKYYCNERTGAMLSNTTTPDGYLVGSDGSRKGS